MSESTSTKVVDARGLACPEPVVRAKRALEEGGFDLLEIIVDNPAAKENVSRFATYSGCELLGVEEKEGTFTLKIKPGKATAQAAGQSSAQGKLASAKAAAIPAASLEGAAGATVFISSEFIGRGDEGLGALLMRGFLYALAEADAKPKRIIFMNSGVKVAAEGSDSLESLRRLSAEGVEILACGTCLDYYKLKERLAVGRISNMYEIAGLLLEGRSLSM